ncbi:MAG: VWA domain-containing protein [Planctomycetaceae bacterium]|nr:VWA domain-containing protein [Planctomycetaceae bacterium]MBT4844881.1 VWA domain-containing protein [Planctomycetaceae bacterium]MBT5599997.1 VWA domain-containing protein [Planctomycetaceae bacterium]MBT5885793.1 VWA domain-containing protein [Planctomycetaceae bacterium]MBT7917699.1 VWA domain-containing protein [Planctomycetaceae bacterium]
MDNSDMSNVDSIPIRGPVGNSQHDFMEHLSSTDDLFYYQSTNQSAMLGSLVLHAVLIVCALLIFTSSTFHGAAQEEVRSGGIVLVEQIGDKPEYFQEAPANNQKTETQQPTTAAQPLLKNSTAKSRDSQGADVDLLGGLPNVQLSGLAGSGDGEVELPSLDDLTGSRTQKDGEFGAVQTGVFGTKGTGSRFIYVFDRSGSMSGYGGRPMEAAKQQLLLSVQDLQENHQFQVIFYNEQPVALNPLSPASPKLLYGTLENREYAMHFVQQIQPDGRTNHIAALDLALNMNPDVIFFLTDADEPQLTTSELNRISRKNTSVRASINTIQFGVGRRTGQQNFLRQLARENGGQYAYVDLREIAPIR